MKPFSRDVTDREQVSLQSASSCLTSNPKTEISVLRCIESLLSARGAVRVMRSMIAYVQSQRELARSSPAF